MFCVKNWFAKCTLERQDMPKFAAKAHLFMTTTPPATPEKKPSRIQLRNRRRILDAALNVFSQHGFRGATLDQIAKEAGLSKPNILYYFAAKEEIHVTLLNQLMETWLDPLIEMDSDGDPLTEILNYVQRKLDMARELPRESRLFANEILQGAPRMAPHLECDLLPLVDEKCAVIQGWMDQGKLAPTDPRHLMYSIWSTTQHYADFEAQLNIISTGNTYDDAQKYLRHMFTSLLRPTGS
jgi:TetR/AcrR family transcriptional regulator